MSTIFPGSASVGQVYNGYTFDGTAWNINGIDLTENYLEESSASATYLTKVSASNTYLTQISASTIYQPKVANISDTEIGYLDNVSSNIQTQLNAKASLTNPTFVTSVLGGTTFSAFTTTEGLTLGNINGYGGAGQASRTNNILSGSNVQAATAPVTITDNYSVRDVGSGGDTVTYAINLGSGPVDGIDGTSVKTINIGTGTLVNGGISNINVGATGVNVSLSGSVTVNGATLVPGMSLVKKQVVGSGVTSVVVNDAFSAAYDNYEILWTGGTMTSSSGDSQIYLSLNGATGSNYKTYLRYTNGTTMNVAAQTTTRFMWVGGGSTGSGLMQIKLYAPYLSVHTRAESHAYNSWNNGFFGSSNGVHEVSGSYTGFTATVSGTGTMSGGTIRVYGYNNG
jgi:hypothetical protein